MERDPDKSSPGNSPSGGGDGGDSGNSPPKAPTDTVEEDVVVSSSFLAPVTTVDITWALSPQESYGKKRGRGEDEGGSSTGGGQKGKKKGELIDPPSTEPKCATCGKTFGSWKAVFGHLRSHPEREYRGAFPPPKIWEEMLRQETARRQHADEGSSGHVEGAAAGMSGRGIEIDLNDPEEPEADKDEFPFDLNMPAPENDEEDDK
ncbi:zinc finger protein ZAT4-like [Benincasa hispida]|uniref:zinc finger protein ZAT4-like n=1 Tax=Benincasa hispida TaxID=102211 RepID=UPI0018FF98E9|nr:zinc finger protein ZAT4-like [Benincasa hispida]